MDRRLEAVLAGWPAAAPRPMSDGAGPAGQAPRPRRARRRRAADGARTPINACAAPLYDRSGELIGAVSLSVGVAEAKPDDGHAHRLASIVESSDDAIVSKDLNGVIASWNAGAQRIFGYSAEEIIGRPVSVLIPTERENEEPGILNASGAANGSTTTRLSADARTAAWSRFLSPSPRSAIPPAKSSALRRSPATSRNVAEPASSSS